MATCQGRVEGYAPMTMAESTKVGSAPTKYLCDVENQWKLQEKSLQNEGEDGKSLIQTSIYSIPKSTIYG